jgi:hypothetical protein
MNHEIKSIGKQSVSKSSQDKILQDKSLQNQAEDEASLSKEPFFQEPFQKKKVRKLLTPEQQAKKKKPLKELWLGYARHFRIVLIDPTPSLLKSA